MKDSKTTVSLENLEAGRVEIGSKLRPQQFP
jgi:hypothetical protein